MKTNRIVAMTLASIAAVALTACAGPGEDSQPRPAKAEQTTEAGRGLGSTAGGPLAPDETPTPTSTPALATNAHGNRPKRVGERATAMSGKSGKDTMTFTMDSIDVDPGCTSGYSELPVNGHFIILTISMTTYPELANVEPPQTVSLYTDMFTVFTDNGTRVNDPAGNGFMCLAEKEQIPDKVGPGQTVKGKIALDVPTVHGSVAYSANQPNDPGWEWSY